MVAVIPSNTQLGVPTKWQLIVSVPVFPFEYLTRSVASPEDECGPMVSQGSGGVPPAVVQLRSSVTLNVPDPGKQPGSLASTVQVPPPVTSFRHLFLASGNVPVPPIVIFEPSLERADARPPGATQPLPTRMRSHRTRRPSSSPSANPAAGTPRAPRTPAAAAPLRICRRVVCRSFMALPPLREQATLLRGPVPLPSTFTLSEIGAFGQGNFTFLYPCRVFEALSAG